MSVQAEWSGFYWEVAPGAVRPLGGLSAGQSLQVERNEDKEGEPATQVVSRELMTLDVDYVCARAATGEDPYEKFEDWRWMLGTYAPFYLGGKKFGCDLWMLKDVKLSDMALDNLGRALSATISLSFEEYAEDESGLKAESTSGWLGAGLMEQRKLSETALGVGPSQSQRAGKMPSNPGM